MEKKKQNLLNSANFYFEKGVNTLNDKYEILKRIGKGHFGNVYQIRKKDNGEFRACKKISKLFITDIEKYKKEVEILAHTHHENLLKIYGIYETVRSVYLITDECKGGKLHDKILEKIHNCESYTEKNACEIFFQLMSGLSYLHNNGILHRNLKPDNLLYLKQENNSNQKNPLKIINFGLNQFYKDEEKILPKTNSAYYIAPEVLEGNFNEKSDIWSAGAILFFLICGRPPFYGNSETEIYENIKKMKYEFPVDKISKISNEVKDLISHMMAPENERYNAKEVLEHCWFNSIRKIPLKNLSFDYKFLADFKNTNSFKKLIITCVASKFKAEQIDDLVTIFENFDINNKGTITYKQLEQGLIKINNKNFSENEIKEVFKSIENNETLSYMEFLLSCEKISKNIKKEKIYEAFSTFDKNNTGFIKKEEIKKVLKSDIGGDHLYNQMDDIIKKVHISKNGGICYKEVCTLLI